LNLVTSEQLVSCRSKCPKPIDASRKPVIYLPFRTRSEPEGFGCDSRALTRGDLSTSRCC
jgi:hypothetical protein